MTTKKGKSGSFRQKIILFFKRHKSLTIILVTVGAVLIWKGLWDVLDSIPLFSNWFITLGLGLFILWLINRYDNLI